MALTIDADAHVIECEATWDYLTAANRKRFQKITLHEADGTDSTGWMVDGHVSMAGAGKIDEEAMPWGVRDMSDVEGRLRMMDEIGTDMQVLYPTMFLVPLTGDPVLEVALYRSYNRWLADRVAKSDGRLSWAVTVPTMNIDAAIEEVRFGKEHGANAVFWRAFEHGMLPTDAYFAPILKEINDLGLALCVHAANGTPHIYESFVSDVGFWKFKLPGLTAFHTVLSSDYATRYPNINFGFVEFQAQWVPYVLKDYVRRGEKLLLSHQAGELAIATLMAERHLFVACQTDDDLSEVLRYAGPNNLVAGTDFGHADTSSELLTLQRLREQPGVDAQSLDNILDANPRALYSLQA